MTPPPIVLTIAGSDSSGGAGMQADARAIQARGGFACTAITAITAQNTRGIVAWLPVSATLITAQIEAVLWDLPVAAVKIGLLPNAASVKRVAGVLAGWPQLPVVIDPVLGSTSGTRFLDDAGIAVLRTHLLPRATLVTPNWPEAERLTERRVANEDEAEAAARALVQSSGSNVLVKGGHGAGTRCSDILVTTGGTVRRVSGERIETRNTHGTGCVLSAAIAAGLAAGVELEDAIEQARALLRGGLEAGRDRVWGAGAGPALG